MRSIALVLGLMSFPCLALAQTAASPGRVSAASYAAAKAKHESFLTTQPTRAQRLDALRKIVRSGTLGERGLQRIFNNFEGQSAIDPTIPGVEKTARLLASSSRSQVKGHTRELLYASRIHTDRRFQLVEMNRKLPSHDKVSGKLLRSWGSTDADIVFRHRTSGMYGRIEVKNYSLASQRTNRTYLEKQMTKMAREGNRTGQPQLWINRGGVDRKLAEFAKSKGIVVYDRVATGMQRPSNTQSFNAVRKRMDAHMVNIAQRRGMVGGTAVGLGASLLLAQLPEAWAAMGDIAALGQASTEARLRMASSGGYSLGGAGLMASGSAFAFAPRFKEVTQNRLYAFGKFGGLLSLTPIVAGMGVDVYRYRSGAVTSEQFWESAVQASAQAAGATAGGWLGLGAVTTLSANPIAGALGATAGSVAGAKMVEYAGGTVVEKIMTAKRQRLDQAFGDAVYRQYSM